MKKFTKLLALPLCFLITSTINSCSAAKREIALITPVGDIDDGGFNQESWEAIRTYASKNHKSYDYYRPFNDSDFARKCAIKQAVAKGAKVVIMPGFQFGSIATYAQDKFPNTHFFLIDAAIPTDENDKPIKPKDNMCYVAFQIEISGFLAGYSVATDYLKYDYKESGNTSIKDEYSLGYCGGLPTDGCYQFGYGYIQGIVNAFHDFVENHEGLEMPTIRIPFLYSGAFAQDDKTAAALKGWYAGGVKTVFSCGGKLYQSVTEALSDYNKKNKLDNYVDWDKGKAPRDAARWIGVDSDQYKTLKYPNEKQSIITSALKGIKQSIADALNFHFTDKWSEIGGPMDETNWRWVLGLDTKFGHSDSIEKKDYVGIAREDFDKDTKIIRGFSNFTTDDFNEINERLSKHNIDVYGNELIDHTEGKREIYKYHLPNKERDGADRGIPEGMANWVDDDEKKFQETYLCNINSEEEHLIVDVR